VIGDEHGGRLDHLELRRDQLGVQADRIPAQRWPSTPRSSWFLPRPDLRRSRTERPVRPVRSRHAADYSRHHRGRGLSCLRPERHERHGIMLACAVASPGRGRGEHAAHEPTAHPRVERPGISVRDHPPNRRHPRPWRLAPARTYSSISTGGIPDLAPDHRIALITWQPTLRPVPTPPRPKDPCLPPAAIRHPAAEVRQVAANTNARDRPQGAAGSERQGQDSTTPKLQGGQRIGRKIHVLPELRPIPDAHDYQHIRSCAASPPQGSLRPRRSRTQEHTRVFVHGPPT
jgi:hypothetical protein